jgi:hypothetical protein
VASTNAINSIGQHSKDVRHRISTHCHSLSNDSPFESCWHSLELRSDRHGTRFHPNSKRSRTAYEACFEFSFSVEVTSKELDAVKTMAPISRQTALVTLLVESRWIDVHTRNVFPVFPAAPFPLTSQPPNHHHNILPIKNTTPYSISFPSSLGILDDILPNS